MPIVSNVSYGNGLHPLNTIPAGARTRQPLSWIAASVYAVVVCLLVLGGPARGLAQTATAKKPTATKSQATKPQVKKTPAKPLYAAPPPRQTLSRRARQARARAAATAREMADTVVPRYKVDASGELVPDVRAAAAIIYDPETNEVLWEENSQSQRSIASITKVMTATVFLENDPDLTDSVTIVRSDVYRASTTYLRANDKVTTGDLLHLLLIASDNAAARALARVSPHGSDGFIARMNEKAAELGLESTHYADRRVCCRTTCRRPTTWRGSSRTRRATSASRRSCGSSEHTVQMARRSVTFRSTNHLLGRDDVDVMAGKTGFISKSGYCLATLLRLPQSGQQVAVVVLGARSNAGRFMETQNLFNWLSGKASAIFATRPPPSASALRNSTPRVARSSLALRPSSLGGLGPWASLAAWDSSCTRDPHQCQDHGR